MPSQGIYRGRPARLRWGTSFASALDVLVDNPISYPEPNEASEFTLSPSGEEDAWISRVEQFLEFDARWIPNTDVLTPRRASGWDGTTGWNAALSWLRQKNTAKWYPDGRNLVVSPKMNADTNADGVVDDFTGSKSTITSTTTFSLDGTDGAQKITVTGNATGALASPVIFADVWGIMPGEVLTLSAEGRHQFSAAGAASQLQLAYYDVASAVLAASSSAAFANSGSYSRLGVTATAPANTVRARVHYYANIPNTGSLTAWVRNMMLERASAASAAFIDNPSVDVKLQEPMKGAPVFESNFLRKLHLKLRAVSGVFDGY